VEGTTNLSGSAWSHTVHRRQLLFARGSDLRNGSERLAERAAQDGTDAIDRLKQGPPSLTGLLLPSTGQWAGIRIHRLDFGPRSHQRSVRFVVASWRVCGDQRVQPCLFSLGCHGEQGGGFSSVSDADDAEAEVERHPRNGPEHGVWMRGPVKAFAGFEQQAGARCSSGQAACLSKKAPVSDGVVEVTRGFAFKEHPRADADVTGDQMAEHRRDALKAESRSEC
jgi:hypothetical protein